MCLLIDDDNEEIFSAVLAEISTDIEFHKVRNAREAICKIRSGEIVADLILLDLNLPGVNGYEFLVYLKGQLRQTRIPVVVYSTVSDSSELVRTKKLGAYTFLEKPGCFKSLKAKLFELLVELNLLQSSPQADYRI